MLASAYADGGAVAYARNGNPTWEAFESALSVLEGGHALAFASGMGAVSCILDLVPVGGVVVSPHTPYSGTRELLSARADAGALQVRWVDPLDERQVTEALRGADVLWLEAATNPLLEVVDVAKLADQAHDQGLQVVVDATFATPLRMRALDLGADVVVHSATKLLSGHTDLLLGVAVTRDADLADRLRTRRTLLGAVAPPFEAWLALRGLRTLALRLDRAEASARRLAEQLIAHPAVARVRYPGWGTLVSVEVAGNATDADAVVAAVQLWTHATSLGGVESTLERRRRWPAESSHVPETLLRLSVGIEDADDLWQDLRAALDAVVARAQ